MSEFRVTHRPVLADKEPVTGQGVSLEALPERCVLHLLAKFGDGDLTAFIKKAVKSDTLSVRPMSPGQWLLVGDISLSQAEVQALSDAMKPKVDVVDQTHGRVRILAHGPQVAQMLAKGTAVDLARDSFPIGYATTTLIGHISAHITRIGETSFEIAVLRGFAESLWDDLAGMSREFS